jgi:glutamate-1-semialdehyde 2,1-aminomutase
MQGIRAGLAAAGIPAIVGGFPQIFHVAFGLTEPARNYRGLMAMDRARYARFCGELLKRRVRALERGAWFLSTTHDDDALDETIAAVADAAQAV